jgi:hypothetical protein
MRITTQPITGKESPLDISSPHGALIDFYMAFNSQNLGLMQSNWLQTEEASMSNPLGGIKRSWREIESVYKNIFYGPAIVYVEFYDYTIHATDLMFVAVGRERGSLEFNGDIIELAIRTSRIYTRHETEWKQVHHHGSMDNPELLAHYQKIVLA